MTQIHFTENEERLLAFSFVFLLACQSGDRDEGPAAMASARVLMRDHPELRDKLMEKLKGKAMARVKVEPPYIEGFRP